MNRIVARARLNEGKGAAKTRHMGFDELSGEVMDLQNPVSICITCDESGFFLLRLDEAGQCISDTWHISFEEAKRQAEFEFSVNEIDWCVD